MLHIKIISPTGCQYEGDVAHATFPGELCPFSVYPSHAPIISSLVKGIIVCFPPQGDKVTIPIESGFVEVCENQITACVE